MDYILSLLPAMWEGTKVTLALFFITLALSIPLGLVIALLRISRFTIVRSLMNIYIWLMRGTPLMLQMLFIYFALPFIAFPNPFGGEPLRFMLPAFPAAIVAFSLNYAAYFAEIFRGGIQSIPKGQYEASKVLGLTYTQTMRRVILPQMFKKILPPLSNEAITLTKDTSLIYVLAISELLRVTQNFVQRDFSPVPFVIAAVFYLVMNLVLTWLFQRLEKRYAIYD